MEVEGAYGGRLSAPMHAAGKHMLSMLMRGRLVAREERKKKRLSNVQNFRLPFGDVRGLFICGTLFLLIIGVSNAHTLSLSLTSFFKRYLPNTRHLAG